MNTLSVSTCPVCFRNSLYGTFCQSCGAYFDHYDYDLDDGEIILERKKPLSLGLMWLVNHCRYNIYKLNLNQVIGATGSPGSCKSYSGLSFCDEMDKTFELERVLFPGIEYIKVFASPNLKRGQWIEWDDAGLGAPSREFWSDLNRAVGMVAQSSRFRQIGLWITLPDKSFLDSQPRKLIDIHLEFIKRKDDRDPAQAWIYQCETNRKTGKIYYKHPILYHPDYGHRKLDIIRFYDLPRESLYKPYEEKKHKYMMDFYKNLHERLERGGLKMTQPQARTLDIAVQLWDEKGYTRKSLADRIGIHEKSLSRAIKQARLKVYGTIEDT